MASHAGTQADRPPVLIVINPSGQRRRVVLGNFPFHIGRQADNQLVLRDNRVSRVHASIENDDGLFFISDLQSRHGVYVNGEKVRARRKLEDADQVGFGFPDGYQLVFHSEETGITQLADQVVEKSRTAGGNLAKLRALVEVARALQGQFSIQEVLESVVEAALAVTGSQRGFLLLSKNGDDLDVMVARDARGMPLSKDDLKVPTRLIRRALNHRRELFSMHFDPTEEGASDPDMSVANLELRSVVCVPLVRVRTTGVDETLHGALNETVGLMYLDSRLELADLSSGNRELVQTLALEASTVLENARLLEQERGKQRMEEELRIARNIQRGLLPRQLPEDGWFRMAASSVSSLQVGGDYYDVARLGEDCWAMVVADVSGKGVSSALLASLLQGTFLLASRRPEEIAHMLQHLNRYLNERTEGEKYATLFYAAIERDGTMHWANAGHCKPILLRPDGGMQSLGPTGTPVGMLEPAEFEVRTQVLVPGEKLVVYSDGLSEAQNRNGDFFDTKRIRQALWESAAMSCLDVHAAVEKAVAEFTCGEPQRDDMTLVVAQYGE